MRYHAALDRVREAVAGDLWFEVDLAAMEVVSVEREAVLNLSLN